MKKVLFIIAILTRTYQGNCFAYNTFVRSYDLANGIHQFGGMISTYDDCYIISGNAYGNGGSPFILKLNQTGDTVYTKFSVYDYGYYGNFSAIEQTNDNGFIVTGSTTSIWVNKCASLQRFDSTGNLLWSKFYPIDSLYYTYGSLGSGVIQTHDGGFLVAGTIDTNNSRSRIFLLKVDGNGNTVWVKKYHHQNNLSAKMDVSTLIQTPDSNYVIVFSLSGDLNVLKTDTLGNVIWDKSYENGFYSHNSGNVAQDGGFILSTGLPGSGGMIIRCDSNGDTLWSKSFNIPIGNVIATMDSGFIFSYYDANFSIGGFIKLDSTGNIVWNTYYDVAFYLKIIETDQGYAAGGHNIQPVYNKLAAINVDPIGGSCNTFAYPIVSGNITPFVTSQSIFGENIFHSDSTFNLNFKRDGYFYIGCSQLTTQTSDAENISSFLSFSPNPFSNNLNLHFPGQQDEIAQLTILNPMGQIVLKREIKISDQSLDLSELPKGLYFVKVKNENAFFSGKIIRE